MGVRCRVAAKREDIWGERTVGTSKRDDGLSGGLRAPEGEEG